MIGHHRDPQKAHPWPKPHLHAKFGAHRSTVATWVRAEEIQKKEKKARKETYSGKLGVRPDHPRYITACTTAQAMIYLYMPENDGQKFY